MNQLLCFALPVLLLVFLSMDKVQARESMHLHTCTLSGDFSDLNLKDNRYNSNQFSRRYSISADFDVRKTFQLEVSVTGRGRRTSQLVSIRGGGIGSDLFNKLEYFKLPDLPLPVIKILLQLALCILNVMCWVIPIKSQNFTQNTYALGLFNFFILHFSISL